MSQKCTSCGNTYPDAGDGWNGKCPNCADREDPGDPAPMESIEINISIPTGRDRKVDRMKLLETIGEILEDRLSEVVNPQGELHGTLADQLGIGDCVPMLSCGDLAVEITL